MGPILVTYYYCALLLTSTGDVVFDAKVSIWPPRVVAGREDDAPHRLGLADNTGDRWSRHDAILADHQVANLNRHTHTHTTLLA